MVVGTSNKTTKKEEGKMTVILDAIIMFTIIIIFSFGMGYVVNKEAERLNKENKQWQKK